MIGLVVPVLSNFKGLAELITSVHCDYNMVVFYVIDNWRINRGVAAGWNEGIKAAISDNCDAILVCNDDVILHQSTIDRLYDRVDDQNMVTAVNMRDHMTYGSFLTMELDDNETHMGPDFSCYMLTKGFYEKVGEFDENFYPAYFEDNDYHYRIQLAGLKAYSTTAAPMYHRGSVTQNMEPGRPVVDGRRFGEERMYYMHKWGGWPGEERFFNPYNDESLSYKDWRKIN